MATSLYLILRRFFSVLRSGWADKEFRGLTLVLSWLVLFATLLYSLREHWSIVDSAYFSVMTLTTIGYGDLAPTTTGMKVYTVAYSVIGIGLFVAFNAAIAQIAIESRRRRNDARNKLDK